MPDRRLRGIREACLALQEEGGAGVGGIPPGYPPGNHVNVPGYPVALAGLPPELPPVDLRKKKYKRLNIFQRNLLKSQRKTKNGRIY